MKIVCCIIAFCQNTLMSHLKGTATPSLGSLTRQWSICAHPPKLPACTTVETGLLVHALLGSIAELYTFIFENAPIMQSFQAPPMSLWWELTRKLARKWASRQPSYYYVTVHLTSYKYILITGTWNKSRQVTACPESLEYHQLTSSKLAESILKFHLKARSIKSLQSSMRLK